MIEGTESGSARTRSEALSRLAGSLAHDLGNLLTPLTWAAQSLDAHLPPDGPAREDLRLLLSGTGQAREFLDDLQAIGGRARPALVAVQADATVEQWVASDSARQLATGFDGEFAVQLAGGPGAVVGDVASLQRVVENLVSRAMANAEPGGSVLLSSFAARCGWCLEVRGSGSVVPVESLPHVFEPFGWGREKGKVGTGLALAVASALTRGMHGQLEYDGSSGANVFTLTLEMDE